MRQFFPRAFPLAVHIPGGESAVRWRRGITDQEDQRGGPAPLLPPVNEGYLSRWMAAGEVMTSNSPDGEHLEKSLWQILVEGCLLQS